MIALRHVRDVALFGGKAVWLGEALRAGLPVPDGIALSAEWVEQLASGDEDAIDQLRAYLLVFTHPVAVRSSVIGENFADPKFAGQHVERLGVQPNITTIVEAIDHIWESGRAAAKQMAITIQRTVASTVAGILFSRDPITGDDVRVIESGGARVRVAHDGTVLDRSPGSKEAPSLDNEQLDALNRLVAKCESVYGGEHELEWAFAGRDLFLLQRRPMTARR